MKIRTFSRNTLQNHNSLKEYVSAATAKNTGKTYRSAILQFQRFGGKLPAHRDAIVNYLLERSQEVKPSTLSLHVTAISQWHQYQGMKDPTDDLLIRKTLKGIRRKHATEIKKAKPLTLIDLAEILSHLISQGNILSVKRDIAFFNLAFFGAFRRSELVSIRVEDLHWSHDGILITLPRSKTDQEGSGIQKAIPYSPEPTFCVPRSLKAWLSEAQITTGPIFRKINRWGEISSQPLNSAAANYLLKKIAEKAGIDASQLSSHSFRRGFANTAARQNIQFDLIKKQGGWKNDSVVYGYIEEGTQFEHNAVKELGKHLPALKKTEKTDLPQ